MLLQVSPKASKNSFREDLPRYLLVTHRYKKCTAWQSRAPLVQLRCCWCQFRSVPIASHYNPVQSSFTLYFQNILLKTKGLFFFSFFVFFLFFLRKERGTIDFFLSGGITIFQKYSCIQQFSILNTNTAAMDQLNRTLPAWWEAVEYFLCNFALPF